MTDESQHAHRPIVSLIGKSEKALQKLTPGTWQHTTLQNNLRALHIAAVQMGLEKDGPFTLDELQSAVRSLAAMIRRARAAQAKFPPGTSHHTLQSNRLKALRIAKTVTKRELERIVSFRAAYQQWIKEDPDWGKVKNANPSEVFAFDIPGGLTVERVAAFSESDAAQQIKGVDDYGGPVMQVPLGQTSRSLSFHFCTRTWVLPFKEPSVPVARFVHAVARLLIQLCHQSKGFYRNVKRKEILTFPFYRFYYDRTEGWWDVMFDL